MEEKLVIVVIYVDDIIFGGNDGVCQRFIEEMYKVFEMSMIGELSFSLELQVAQLDDGIFIFKANYIKEMLKKLSM